MKIISFYAHVIVVLSGCYFLTNYDTNTFNATKQIIQQFINASFDKQFEYYLDDSELIVVYSTMTSMIKIAEFPMFIVASFVTDRIGRTKSLIIGISVSILGVAVFEIAIFSSYFELIYVARTVEGVGSALIVLSRRLYFAEIVPTKQRGLVSGLKEFVRSTIAALALILGNSRFLGSQKLWPILIGLAVPFGVASLIRLCVVPDTPTHLMIRNPHKAQKAFEFYTAGNNSLTFMPGEPTEDRPIDQENKKSYLTVLKENKRVFGIVLCAKLMNVISMGHIYKVYGILILQACSLSSARASDVGTVIGCGKIAIALVTIPIMSKVPRKKFLVALMLFQQVSGILVVTFAALVSKYKIDWAVTGCVVAVSLGWMTSSIADTQTTNIVVESCNQQSRAIISSLCSASTRLVTIVIQLVLPTVVSKLGVSIALAPLLIGSSILLIISLQYMRETGNSEIGTAYENIPLINNS